MNIIFLCGLYFLFRVVRKTANINKADILSYNIVLFWKIILNVYSHKRNVSETNPLNQMRARYL